MPQSTTRNKSNVSFDPHGDIIIPDSCFHCRRNKEDLKELWYSREELMDSCNEAKKIVKLIQLVGGKLEAIDHSAHCVVGLEKYHGKKEREKYRKMLIRSVLIRQEMNRGLGLGTSENGCLSEISQMMSSSFKDFALWQAAMHEFHAYGSSKPSQSLLVSKAIIARSSCPSSELPNIKRSRPCVSTSNVTPVRGILNHNGGTNSINNNDKTKASANPTSIIAQNQMSLKEDTVKVTGSCVNQKRPRCEVVNFVESQFQPFPHIQSPSCLPSNPLLQARR
jgi:hypothetical protein